MSKKLETLLRSRKLWAALSGLALVVAAALDPDFPLQGEETAAVAALLSAYIVGTAIDVHRNPPDAGAVKNRLSGMLASRKFWAAVVGVVFTVVQAVWPDFPLQAEQVTEVIALLSAYILGTAVEDRLTTAG
jgi:hypothetical protein